MCIKQSALELEKSWGKSQLEDSSMFVIGAKISKGNSMLLERFVKVHRLTFPVAGRSDLGYLHDVLMTDAIVISKNRVYSHKIKSKNISENQFDNLFVEGQNVMFGAPYVINLHGNIMIGAKNSEMSIDLNTYFKAESGEDITFSVSHSADPAIATIFLDGANLNLKMGEEYGSCPIKIKAESGNYSEEHSFEITNALDFVYDDFEGKIADFWTNDSLHPWQVIPKGFSGNYSLRSGLVDKQEKSTISTNIFMDKKGKVSYSLYFSTEINLDSLLFYVDDTFVQGWSGKCEEWMKIEHFIDKGNHDLKWVYKKGAYDNYENVQDLAIIDALVIEKIQSSDIFSENHLKILSLNQNYPNPFNSQTTISFSLNKNYNDCKISIFNMKGRKVDEVILGALSKGENNIVYNANNISSGVYFYRLEVGSNITTPKKMIFLK